MVFDMDYGGARPKITVITVCFNEKKTIRDTLDSILCQSSTDFEYIVKDGGSRDGTLSIVRSYEKKFKSRKIPMRLIIGRDRGIYDAMNIAAAGARGSWVNFMNAGDTFFSGDVLEKVCKYISGIGPVEELWSKSGLNPLSEAVTMEELPVLARSGEKEYRSAVRFLKSRADIALFYGDTAEEEFGELHYFRKCPDLIEERMPFSHQSVFVRRELLLLYPFRLKYPIAADYDFLLTLHKKGGIFIDTGILIARVTKTGKSSLKLRDTYVESLKVRKSHDIPVLQGKALKRKLMWLNIKQFGMDYFPSWLKYCIRKVQRKLRGQNRV